MVGPVFHYKVLEPSALSMAVEFLWYFFTWGNSAFVPSLPKFLLSKYAFAYKRDKMKEKISIKHRKQTNPSGFSKD